MAKKSFSLILCAVILMSVFSLCTTAKDTSPEYYTDIFEKDNVIDIKIEIDDADLSDILDHPTNEEYHSADITIDGITLENVGIRTKGNMTLSSVARSDSDRYSYRIKFNKYVKGQKLLGLDELCLNSGYSDRSYMREYLHYEILEQLGMDVPERAYCNVYINGDFAGFYLAIEGLDDSFLERSFGEDYEDGNFYKMDEGSTLQYEENEIYSYVDFKNGTDDDLTEFKKFVKALNDVPTGEKGDIEDFLDVDSALKYIASNTVLCNYDSYNGNKHHNFYLYETPDGVFTVVPWDFNMSFGGFNGTNATVGIDTPVVSGSIDSLPLINKLLSVDEYKEKYYGYIKEIMDILGDFEERVAELKEIISPYVKNDTTAFYTYEEFDKATSKSDTADYAEPSKDTERPDGFGGFDPNGERPDGNMPEQGEQAEKGERPDGGGFGGHGGGGGFGSNVSIIDCVTARLENLTAQFNGDADKDTSSNSQFGGKDFGNRGERPEGDNMPDKSDPNEFNPNGFNPNGFEPNGFDPNGSDGNPPELPDGFNPDDNRQNNGDFPGEPPTDGFNSDGEMPQGGRHNRDENGQFGGFGGDFGGNRRPDNAENNDAIRVHVNGHIISFPTDPYIEDGTTLVGYRAIMEALDADVSWDGDTQTVTAVKGDTTITLTIGSDTAYVNGEAKTLSLSPQIINDSTIIPVRFISEELGMKVEWTQGTKLITISSKK